jgi:hypothetical protein
MWYGLIFLVIVGVLARRHIRSPDASERSKRLVMGLIGGSVLAVVLWPALVILATLVVAGVGIYVILRENLQMWEREMNRQVTSPPKESAKLSR